MIWIGAGRRAKTRSRLLGGVAREVEEDVDPVGADLRGERIVVEPDDVVPLVRRRREPVGQVVAVGPVVIADHRERARVEVLEHADQEEADGMAAEVGGDESEAERPLGVAIEVPRLPRPRGSGAACRSSHSAWARARPARVDSALVLLAHQQVRVRGDVARPQRQGAVIGAVRLLVIALSEQRAAEVVVRLGRSGLSATARRRAAIASSSRPLPLKATPRLLWASA